AELSEITPLLLAAGAGSLGWRRIQAAGLNQSAESRKLQQAYRLHTLQATVQERAFAPVLERLRAAGIDPLLAKGWAVARHYPEPGLRPYGDFDLCVRPGQYEAAKAALFAEDGPGCAVDLHRGLMRQWTGEAFSFMDDRRLEELYERSQ